MAHAATDILALSAADVMRLVEPARVIDALAGHVRAGLWDGVPNPMILTQAELGADAGLIGAALATLQPNEPAKRPQRTI